jgi:hypothetical protein
VAKQRGKRNYGPNYNINLLCLIAKKVFFKSFKFSASSRISKGQGARLPEEKGREQFWPKKGNLRCTMKNLKNGQNFTLFSINKMFSHKF